MNVKERSFKLNTFTIPRKLISNMANHPNWEILTIRLKNTNKTVAVSFNYKARNNYAFLAVGLDYDYVTSHGVYKQILFQTILRGKALNKENTLIGMDAPQEKRKFGTTVYPKVMYAQVERNFSMEKINLMQIKTN
jgi:hypothetical protein